MNAVSRAAVRCTRCYSSGISADQGACETCGGSGQLPRLVVPIKVVAATDLVPTVDMLFQRLAVTSVEPTEDNRVVLRGITDRGVFLVAAMLEGRFRGVAPINFVEDGATWPL
jgi:hypothetical protein